MLHKPVSNASCVAPLCPLFACEVNNRHNSNIHLLSKVCGQSRRASGQSIILRPRVIVLSALLLDTLAPVYTRQLAEAGVGRICSLPHIKQPQATIAIVSSLPCYHNTPDLPMARTLLLIAFAACLLAADARKLFAPAGEFITYICTLALRSRLSVGSCSPPSQTLTGLQPWQARSRSRRRRSTTTLMAA